MSKRYVAIFCFSFVILSLQIVLSLLLDVIAYIPFIAISFSFFGLSLAGVYTFIKYYSQGQKSKNYLPIRQMILGGTHIIISLAVLYYYNQFAIEVLEKIGSGQLKTTLNYLRLHIIFCSTLAGVLFSIAFFQFGTIVCLLYKENSDQSPKFYLFDLCGAAMGCIFTVIILNLLQVGSVLIFLASTVFALSWYLTKDNFEEKKNSEISRLLFIFSIILLCINIKCSILEMKISPALSVGSRNATELWSKWNIYSRTALVKYRKPKSQKDEYTFVLNFNAGKAIFVPYDKHNPYQYKLFKRFTPVTLSFLSQQPQDILILFAGAGIDMIQAYSYSKGQANITGVELNPLIISKALSLPEFHLKEFFGKKNINMVVQEGRSFLEQTSQLYDSIILSWSGATLSNYLGTSANTGQYLYTKEAIVTYLKRLKPEGTIGFVHGSPRLLAVIKAAFDEMGYEHPKNNVVEFIENNMLTSDFIEGNRWDPFQARLFLVKKTPFTIDEVEKIRMNIAKMNLTIVYSPFHTHPGFETDQKILKNSNIKKYMEGLSKRYQRDLTLGIDDKPYMHNSFRFNGFNFAQLKEMLSVKKFLHAVQNDPFQEMMLHFIFIFIVFSFILIIAPLAWAKKFSVKGKDILWLFYFSLLGLGFILVEIAVMHKFTLFLGNPVYAFSIILASLLFTSGLGSLFSKILFEKNWLSIKKTAFIVCSVLLLYFLALHDTIKMFLGVSFMVKIFLSFILILPLGLVLGVLFPQGLKILHRKRPHLIPWALAFNGYTSIVGSLISSYLCLIYGVNIYFLIAACLYMVIFGIASLLDSQYS